MEDRGLTFHFPELSALRHELVTGLAAALADGGLAEPESRGAAEAVIDEDKVVHVGEGVTFGLGKIEIGDAGNRTRKKGSTSGSPGHRRRDLKKRRG